MLIFLCEEHKNFMFLVVFSMFSTNNRESSASFFIFEYPCNLLFVSTLSCPLLSFHLIICYLVIVIF